MDSVIIHSDDGRCRSPHFPSGMGRGRPPPSLKAEGQGLTVAMSAPSALQPLRRPRSAGRSGDVTNLNQVAQPRAVLWSHVM
jgi:hypothetical protein